MSFIHFMAYPSFYFPYDRAQPKLWSYEVNNGAVLLVPLRQVLSYDGTCKGLLEGVRGCSELLRLYLKSEWAGF